MKKINFDAMVGLFVLAGFLAFVYMSLQLGEFSVFSMEKTYSVQATFENVSGLKRGALVEMAGVNVGKVSTIALGENDRAQVHLQINNGVKITDDAIASIKTQGIIGDKYIKISQGGSEDVLVDGGVISETESALDLEELVSKYIFGKVE
ncbi:outer membrane lipid asymmetry maintenance protein MlaD [Thiovibrio frasassiensis]|jgi:phospholipid/cholesterol/gamma-HCH transport system substrate-binding protein|uniref:Outer membrane lipid asymmetry maintenance protein MlaD n=1 Tax=Thiovibrio frasassiensis TaxID=2984131 RepID=A0A9X4MP96_9BACT|nr:outer membrane lipid asymmetry maintenance protein MlaD [Thiovibrio frasassiensis]MDG4476387.1 outer membrane lipid asymmetry maintenance protein MlaD [Thiovibrio frasassiensis]